MDIIHKNTVKSQNSYSYLDDFFQNNTVYTHDHPVLQLASSVELCYQSVIVPLRHNCSPKLDTMPPFYLVHLLRKINKQEIMLITVLFFFGSVIWSEFNFNLICWNLYQGFYSTVFFSNKLNTSTKLILLQTV